MSLRRVVGLMLLGIIAGNQAAIGCVVEFDGSEFLAAYSENQVPTLEATCSVNDPQKNRFFAPPGKACVLVFEDKVWLKIGKFKQIKGKGQFKAAKVDKGMTVTINREGGLYVTLFKIEIDGDKCADLSVRDVLN